MAVGRGGWRGLAVGGWRLQSALLACMFACIESSVLEALSPLPLHHPCAERRRAPRTERTKALGTLKCGWTTWAPLVLPGAADDC